MTIQSHVIHVDDYCSTIIMMMMTTAAAHITFSFRMLQHDDMQQHNSIDSLDR